MLSTIYPRLWSGTDALIYDALCEEMGRIGTNQLPNKAQRWFWAVSKVTLRAAEDHLVTTGFIRVKNGAIEVLHPETSQSMPQQAWDQEKTDRAYYVDDNGCRRLFSNEQLTPEVFELYFRKSLPRPDEWVVGSNAHCPFHNDQTPSMSIDVETGRVVLPRVGLVGTNS